MIIFLDTMIYLHYQSIEEIDFLNDFDVDNITLIVPRVIIRELDKQKNINKSSKIRERARKVLKKLEKWIACKEVRPGVSLEYMVEEPNNILEETNLNPNWNDDLLIAAILQYKANNKKDTVILITQDSGPRLTALHHDLHVEELPDKYKLPTEPDPVEAENQDLRQKLKSLENTLPKLTVSFLDSETPINNKNFTLPPQPIYKEDTVENTINELKQKYPHITKSDNKHLNSDKGSLPSLNQQLYAGMIGINTGIITEEEVKRYNKEVDEYFNLYRNYLMAMWESSAALKRSIRFVFEIWNQGTAPANDVDVSFFFPDGFSLFLSENLPVAPKKPKPPLKPRSEIEVMASRFASIVNTPQFATPDLNKLYNDKTNDFSIKRTNSYEVSDHFQTIKHGSKVALPEMILTFDSYESAKSFKCEYIIRPANLPSPIKGELHFKITKTSRNK